MAQALLPLPLWESEARGPGRGEGKKHHAQNHNNNAPLPRRESQSRYGVRVAIRGEGRKHLLQLTLFKLAKAKAECMQGLNPPLITPVATQMQYHAPPEENFKMLDVSPAQRKYNGNARQMMTRSMRNSGASSEAPLAKRCVKISMAPVQAYLKAKFCWLKQS